MRKYTYIFITSHYELITFGYLLVQFIAYLNDSGQKPKIYVKIWSENAEMGKLI